MATIAEMRGNISQELRTTLAHLYDILPVGVPTEYKTATLAEHLGVKLPLADDRCIQLTDLGLLTRKINYGRPDASGVWHVGRWAEWTLHLPLDQAMARLEEWITRYQGGEVLQATIQRAKFGQRKRKPREVVVRERDMTEARNQPLVAPGGPIERVTVAKDPGEDVRAVAGPDKASPFEALRPLRKAGDAEALVEAARQYANRSDKVHEHIDALVKSAKDLGLVIDEAAVMNAVSFERDERLETVSLVLPMIDALTARVESLNQQVLAQKAKVREYDAIATENRRLKSRVEALVSERVHTAQTTQRAQA